MKTEIFSINNLSLVIPVFNESGSLKGVLDSLPEGLFEVILVDGISRDNTIAIAQAHPRVSKVIVQKSRGKGAALSAGFAAATGELIAIIDADGSMDPRELFRFLELIPNNDIVKGSRYLPNGGSDDITFVRSWGNKTLTWIANKFFRQKWTDMAYGFALFRASIIKDIGLTNFDQLGSFLGHKTYGQGFEIETLMFTRAAKRNFRIAEIWSWEADRVSGSSNLRAVRDGTRVLMSLMIEKLRSA
jgi:glycosyltransferase involved in cell wall biosynthesis